MGFEKKVDQTNDQSLDLADEAANLEIQKTSSKKAKKLPIVPILVAILVVIVAIGGMSVFGATRGITEKDVVTESQLKEIIDIDELSTAEFVYCGIAEKLDSKGKKQYNIMYDATVKAGVKMSDISFAIDESTKTITATLPEVIVNDVHVSEEMSYIPNDPKDFSLAEAVAACEDDVLKEASSSPDLKKAAEDNMKATVEALTMPVLSGAGYVLVWAE